MSGESRNRYRSLLLTIIAGAAAIRLVRLGSLPSALFRDEAEKGYNAFCLLKTGRDVSGHLLPLFINVFGVTTSAIYQYAAIPFVWLLGLNEWAVRLPAALAALATIAVNAEFLRRERGAAAALWASLFLALSPWHIMFSRWAQQGIFLPFFLAAAMLFWRGFLDRKPHALVLCAMSLGLAIYSYDVARLFVPLMVVWIALLYWRELLAWRRETILAAFVLLVAALPLLILQATHPGAAQARFNAISIFGNTHSPIEVLKRFSTNYASHFSPAFLLWRGDPELRHSPGVGELNIIEAVALVFGIAQLLRKRRREDLIWLGWLLLFPVAASLTRVGVPHALRCIVALPAIQNVASIGLVSIHELKPVRRSNRVLQEATALAILLGFAPFAFVYFGSYARRSAISWQYGVKQALELLHPRLAQLDTVEFYNITGAEYLVPFYENIAPKDWQSEAWRKSKYHFPPFNYPPDLLRRRLHGHAGIVTLPISDYLPVDGSLDIIPAPNSNQPAMVVYYLDESTTAGRSR